MLSSGAQNGADAGHGIVEMLWNKRFLVCCLLVQVSHDLFVTGLQPLKSFPLPDRQPDIHQIGVMFGETLEAEEVHVRGIDSSMRHTRAPEQINESKEHRFRLKPG